MGLSCKISYDKKGVAHVTDEMGNPSILYRDILKVVDDQKTALNMWATAYEDDFGAQGEQATVNSLLRYFDSKIASERRLSSSEIIQVQDFMRKNGIESLGELHQKLIRIFKPNGVFNIDAQQAIDSGLYSQEEIKNVDPSAIQDILWNIEGHLVIDDFTVETEGNRYQYKNSSKTTLFGTYLKASQKDIDNAIIEAVDSFTDENSFYDKIKTIPYEDFVERFYNDDQFGREIINRFRHLKKIPALSVVGENIVVGDNRHYTTTKNTMMVNPDTTIIESETEYLESISPDVWSENLDTVRNVLLEVEKNLSSLNIDVVGIADNTNKRDEVINLLRSAQTLLENPSETTLQDFSTRYNELVPQKEIVFADRLDDKYTGYNIVKMFSNKSQNELFNRYGLIKVGENLYHKVDQTANVNDIKDYIYEAVKSGEIKIPEKYMLTKNMDDKPKVLEDISRYLMSQKVDVVDNQELYSAYQVAFDHNPVVKEINDVRGLSAIRTDVDYLKTDFVSDFYNYILEEKANRSLIYDEILSKFYINDRDITLIEPIESIDNLKYSNELKDYIRLHKDSSMKYLVNDSTSIMSEDMLYLNFPERKQEFEGDMIIDGNYIITNPTSDNYIKLNDELYRKEMSKEGADLFVKVTTPVDNIYYSAGTNFEFDREAAKNVFDKYSTLDVNNIDYNQFSNIIARSRVNDNMRRDLKEKSTLKDKSYIFYEVGNSVVAYKDGKRVGSIRVDKVKNGYGNVHFSVAEMHRHKGVGTELYLRFFDKVAREGKTFYPSATRTQQAENVYSRLQDLFVQQSDGGVRIKDAEEEISIEKIISDIKYQTTFESNALKGLSNITQKAATPDQWVKMISDKGGKGTSQELEWIGLQDFLNNYIKENNTKSVPKEVVEQYINDNQIEIVEVSKNEVKKYSVNEVEEAGYTFEKYSKEEFFNEFGWYAHEGQNQFEKLEDYIVYRAEAPKDHEDFETVQQINTSFEVLSQIIGENMLASTNERATKYSNYKLEGGENYREVLLTLPQRTTLPKGFKVKEEIGDSGMFKGKTVYRVYDSTGDYITGQFITEGAAINSAIQKTQKLDAKTDEYFSPHWDESNILAHVRMNERVLPNGERVLFIEEVQSDWAQEGKKKGFGENKIGDEVNTLDGKATIIDIFENGLYFVRYKNGKEKTLKSFDFDYSENKGVPQMPYKKTDQWVGMAMRRVMQMASQEGFDRVSWVTGEQSADRYSLSNQVDFIDVLPKESSRFVFISMKNDSDTTLEVNENGEIIQSSPVGYEGKNAEDVLGKEITKKILGIKRVSKEDYVYSDNLEEFGEKGVGYLNKEGQVAIFSETKKEADEDLSDIINDMQEESTKLQGEGLEVGGEGMKTFYNSILPKVAKKEAQRFDKKANIEVIYLSEGKGFRLWNKSDDKFLGSFDGEYTNVDEDGNITKVIPEDYKSPNEVAKELGVDIKDIKIIYTGETGDNKGGREQLSIPITPQMREVFKKPIPLFQDKPSLQEVPLNIFKSVVDKLESTGLTKNSVVYDRQGFSKELRRVNNQNGSNARFQDVAGFVVDNTVYINPTRINVNTPIHEFAHLWSEWARNNNPELYSRGTELISGTEYHNQIIKEASNSDSVYYSMNEDQLLEEALVRAIGDKGESFVNEFKRSDFKQWLSDLWNSIRQMIGISDISANDLQNLTVDEFAKAVSIDLLKGKTFDDFTDQEKLARFQIIGERGAARLDSYDPTINRMNNLNVAIAMEKAGKSAEAIRLSTGWENGADSKWKYEIQDIELNVPDLSTLELDEDKFIGGRSAKLLLSDIAVADELFAAYPTMKDTVVTFYESDVERVDSLSMFEYKGGIFINLKEYGRDDRQRSGETVLSLRSGTVHELQHVIQGLEGFGGGTSEAGIRKGIERVLAYNKVGNVEDVEHSEYLRSIQHMLNSGQLSENSLMALNDPNSIAHEITLGNLSRFMYWNSYGEVEARNVQERLTMSPEERAKKLLEVSGNIANKDQIFIADFDISALPSVNNKAADDIYDLSQDKNLSPGGSRFVQEIDKGVIKVADDIVGEYQNAVEGLLPITPTVIEKGQDYVIVEKVQMSNSNKLDRFRNMLKQTTAEDWTTKNKKLRKDLESYGVDQILDDRFSLLYGDIIAENQWGIKGDQIMLVDAGSLVAGYNIGIVTPKKTPQNDAENISSIFDSRLELLDLYSSKEEAEIAEKIDSCGG